jgi:hypothetical protein
MTVGALASSVAARLGLAGTFEMINQKGTVLRPETPLADLDPADSTDITLAPSLTPA